jgi:gliding motility-associated lipoprotein GldD
MKNKYVLIVSSFIMTFMFISCEKNYIPKPRGYFRIDLPEHKYQIFDTLFPYRFEYSKYANYEIYNKDSAWINIVYPEFKSKIHITYKNPKFEDINEILEESQQLAYKHTLKADAIDEDVIVDTSKKVYGILYYMEGNSASNLQFYITDSTKHFFRGSLYFFAKPNYDSIRPVLDYIKTDVKHLIKTMEWK